MDVTLLMNPSECNSVDEHEWIPYSNVQIEDPFAISDISITISKSNKLTEKIVALIQNMESKEELLGQATTSLTTFIYSAVSHNS